MRLSPKEKSAILRAIYEKDGEARIFLYGSRSRGNLKGGDIDLLVLSEHLSFSDKIDILVAIKDVIGEQKIDLSIKTIKQAQDDAFFSDILNQAEEIT